MPPGHLLGASMLKSATVSMVLGGALGALTKGEIGAIAGLVGGGAGGAVCAALVCWLRNTIGEALGAALGWALGGAIGGALCLAIVAGVLEPLSLLAAPLLGLIAGLICGSISGGIWAIVALVRRDPLVSGNTGTAATVIVVGIVFLAGLTALLVVILGSIGS